MRWLDEDSSTPSDLSGLGKLMVVRLFRAASFLDLTLLCLAIEPYWISSSPELTESGRPSEVERRSWDLRIGSYVPIGSGPDLFLGGPSCEDSGTTGFSVDAVLMGLLARPSILDEVVPGRISGLDVMPTIGEERMPRALSGDEMIGFGEIEFPRRSAGEGREEVGLASLIADENCVPRKSCDVGRSWERLFRKGFWGGPGVSGKY